jgi:circadian clock protein KaiB
MSKRRSAPRYKFSVYIARETRMSALAVNRLKKICEAKVPGDYDIQVIDISKHPDLARNQNILATPAIFRTLPAPLRKSIGDLSDKDRTVLGLGF